VLRSTVEVEQTIELGKNRRFTANLNREWLVTWTRATTYGSSHVEVKYYVQITQLFIPIFQYSNIFIVNDRELRICNVIDDFGPQKHGLSTD